jgi:probable HAF family extracellular repeat protein
VTNFALSYTFEVQPGLTTAVFQGSYAAHAINDLGQIVGTIALRGPSSGFLYDMASNQVRTDVVPGTPFSSLGGINDLGELAGSVFPLGGGPKGIVISHGTPEVFTYPGSQFTRALGINNWGQVVGQYSDATGLHGFAGTPDHLRSIDVPGGSQTEADAINDWGQIVGFYTDATGNSHGFLETPLGQFKTIDVPDGSETTVTGINDWGQMVGSYADSGGQRHGFVLTADRFQTLDLPDSSRTNAVGINNLGQIVGTAAATVTAGPITVSGSQVWVASPHFIYQSDGDGVPLASALPDGVSLPNAQDVTSLLRSVMGSGSEHLKPALAPWVNLASATAGPVHLSQENGSASAQVWIDLSNHNDWSLISQ